MGTKNAFDVHISRLDMAEQRISELGRATESSKNKENKNWRWGEGRSKPEDRKVIWWPKYFIQTILVSYLAVRQETDLLVVCVWERESEPGTGSIPGGGPKSPCAMCRVARKTRKRKKRKSREEKLLLLLTSWLPILYSAMWKCTAGRGGDFRPGTREGIAST